jgi:hypothetical protein
MDEAVMTPAQQARVREIRFAAVDPVNQVVAVAPVGRAVAAGEPASSVADDQRSP